MADGDGGLNGIITPGGDVLSGAIIWGDAAVSHREEQRSSSDHGFGERSGFRRAGMVRSIIRFGVYFSKPEEKWQSRITYLGRFTCFVYSSF
jgi:hypothetical protein